MMRFSVVNSVAGHSRSMLLLMKSSPSYPGRCIQCMKLHRGIVNMNIVKNFYRSEDEKYVNIHSDISVKEMAKKLNVKSTSIMNILQDIDYDTRSGTKTMLGVDIAELIAGEFGFLVSEKTKKTRPRPPVVTIMGHVDHGKTTLLDNLRNTSVAPNEAGGITQSIGAFSVKVPGLSDVITFVDTPGHAAFNSMRARGAQLTDIVVLVVAADDGVMPQTKECLKHISEANVPYIIAINKIDKGDASPERVHRELIAHGVKFKEYGGDVEYASISALKRINIDNFLILLNSIAKQQQLEASHDGPVKAIIMEAEHSKTKGVTTSVLMRSGTLSKGKVLLSGSSWCKVRQITDINGETLHEAFPSDPVQITGWRSLPTPGDHVFEMENEAEVKNLLKLQERKSKPVKVAQRPLSRRAGKKPIPAQFKSGQGKHKGGYHTKPQAETALGSEESESEKTNEINIVLKADVSGSLEALLGILTKFYSKDIKFSILDASVGQVTLNDLHLAESCNGIVYTFNSEATNDVITKAATLKIPLKQFDVIYKLLDDLKEEIEAIFPYKIKENIIGEGDVQKVFNITGRKKGAVAGCRVTKGNFDKSIGNTVWRVVRDNKGIHDGVLSSLKHGAVDIQIAKQFSECGVMLKGYVDLIEGDRLLCVQQEKYKETCEWEL